MVSIWLMMLLVAYQEPDKIVQIEFTTMSRGGHREYVKIEPNCVTIEVVKMRGTESDVRKKSLTINQWQRIINTLDNVALTDIPNMESPTMKRAFDGAFHSELTITTMNEQNYRHHFDDLDPHESLSKLMKLVKVHKK